MIGTFLPRLKVARAKNPATGQGGPGAQDFLQSPQLAWAPPHDVNPPTLIGSYQITGTPQFVPLQAKAQLWDLTSQQWFKGFSILTRPRNSAMSA
jgi:hypothetical protein